MHVSLYGGIHLRDILRFRSWLPFQNDVAAFISTQSTKTFTLNHIRSIFDGSIGDSNIPLTLSNISAKSAFATPIFLSRSQDDEVVPITHGENLYPTLRDLGFDVTWKKYEDGWWSLDQ